MFPENLSSTWIITASKTARNKKSLNQNDKHRNPETQHSTYIIRRSYWSCGSITPERLWPSSEYGIVVHATPAARVRYRRNEETLIQNKHTHSYKHTHTRHNFTQWEFLMAKPLVAFLHYLANLNWLIDATGKT